MDLTDGEEAVAVGVSTALRPSDMLLLADDEADSECDAGLIPGPEAVVVRLLATSVSDAAARLEAARRHQPWTLILLWATTDEIGRRGTVDGFDVEAVLSATAAGLRAVRAGNGPLLLRLRTDDQGQQPDPIETLVVRMTMAHQLDTDALQAIDADAASRARTVQLATSRPHSSSRYSMVRTRAPA
ncbi:hypothetical protein [Actinoplanes sp. NPDC049118]|uniref:hypothetical protein n=1 Tax=Actinoplanes sp. NPDC049118 TaxID=3155769 RepID=UPI0033FFE50C